MARAEDHLAELLRLSASERARAARTLIDSLHDGADDDAADAQLTELERRLHALDAGEVELVDHQEARARVLARLRSLRNAG